MAIDPLVVVRAIHFASSVIVAGGVAFGVFIGGPAHRRADAGTWGSTVVFGKQNALLLRFGLLLAVASSVVWLVLVAADIAGEPWRDVIGNGTAWTVLTDTQFGLIMQLRLLTAAALAVLLLGLGQPPAATGWIGGLAVAAAALYLGSLALTGHAAGGPGIGGGLHLLNDIAHILAAGLWVGGLIPLLLFLRQPGASTDSRWLAMVADVLWRFSTMGVVIVAVLAASGILNTWFVTDRMRALLGTDYGRLLQIKIALFVAMFCLATINRVRLLPRLSPTTDDTSAQRAMQTLQQIRRNTALEALLGLAVICVVGVLGVTPPPGHIHSAAMSVALRPAP